MTTVKLFDQEWEVRKCNHPKLHNGFEIDFTQMYEPPIMAFNILEKISDHFGTKDIDLDNVSMSGCESCDYGSRYGYRINVYNATKNIPILR